jgi:hypothetical protein
MMIQSSHRPTFIDWFVVVTCLLLVLLVLVALGDHGHALLPEEEEDTPVVILPIPSPSNAADRFVNVTTQVVSYEHSKYIQCVCRSYKLSWVGGCPYC